ncbi:MAG: hypothetical protein LUD77_09360 [Clostridiales bacterium]|nr:hypothetical protein [Clostridiales bacterium]
MKIIKPGNEKLTKKPILFDCVKCGCVFEADCEEYTYAGSYYGGTMVRCKCPCCGDMIYMSGDSSIADIFAL